MISVIKSILLIVILVINVMSQQERSPITKQTCGFDLIIGKEPSPNDWKNRIDIAISSRCDLNVSLGNDMERIFFSLSKVPDSKNQLVIASEFLGYFLISDIISNKKSRNQKLNLSKGETLNFSVPFDKIRWLDSKSTYISEDLSSNLALIPPGSYCLSLNIAPFRDDFLNSGEIKKRQINVNKTFESNKISLIL